MAASASESSTGTSVQIRLAERTGMPGPDPNRLAAMLFGYGDVAGDRAGPWSTGTAKQPGSADACPP